METITKAKIEEREMVYSNKDNVETLSFHRSGSLSYSLIEEGKKKKRKGNLVNQR